MSTSLNLTLKQSMLGLCGLILSFALNPLAQAAPSDTASGERHHFSGPYSHENLSIYLIHGQDKFDASNLLTLDEALERKQVIVHETGDVNELSIQNTSKTSLVFVQAGDIVKGGKQDRVLSQDMLLKPNSGKIPLASFCVEQGRWQQRQGEAVDEFSSSKKRINSKELKLAAQSEKDQGKVWGNVEQMQAKLENNTRGLVRSDRSSSSLQLSLESKPVVDSTNAYLKTLLPILEGKNDAVGYMFAINGGLNSAEVYGANSLFKKLWPKLLEATTSEAIAESHATKVETQFSPSQLEQFLLKAESAAIKEKKQIAASESTRRENDKAAYFETRASSYNDAIIHKQYLSK